MSLSSDADAKTIEQAAHGGYVAAINSNDLGTLMASLTDDVIYQAPGSSEIVGKAAVRRWAADYLAAYRTKWEKTSIGFTVDGDWAFERYTYRSTDTDRATGAVSTEHREGHQYLSPRAGREMASGDRRVELGQACVVTPGEIPSAAVRFAP